VTQKNKKDKENSGKQPKRETGGKKLNRKLAVNCTKVQQQNAPHLGMQNLTKLSSSP